MWQKCTCFFFFLQIAKIKAGLAGLKEVLTSVGMMRTWRGERANVPCIGWSKVHTVTHFFCLCTLCTFQLIIHQMDLFSYEAKFSGARIVNFEKWIYFNKNPSKLVPFPTKNDFWKMDLVFRLEPHTRIKTKIANLSTSPPPHCRPV